jgi:hypothetical protein
VSKIAKMREETADDVQRLIRPHDVSLGETQMFERSEPAGGHVSCIYCQMTPAAEG